ncbi:MAG: NAD(P)-dependent oxidoreductase [Alphaproteobacteria bacterium]|nr:NAD(P)-dependent oxidoreductase [Alphaproteobacteria bacterium]
MAAGGRRDLSVLVTGARGYVGTGIRPVLRERFRELALADLRPVDDLAENERFLEGDVGEAAFVERAMSGVDAVVHLACAHGLSIPFADTVRPNYHGTVNIFAAAHARGIRNVVFASSHHVTGFYPRGETVGIDRPARPDGFYAVSKAFGEAVGALYADKFGMTVTSIRIGSALGKVLDERRLHMWISFRDLAELVCLALAREGPGHEIVYGVGDCPEPFFDNSGAKRLGFVPRDRPEDFLRQADILDAAPDEGVAGLVVGGGFAAADFEGDPARLARGKGAKA